MSGLRVAGVTSLVVVLGASALLAHCGVCGVGGAKGPKADKEGFVPLFNGKDLAGWKVDDAAREHWKVVDGVIMYDGKNKTIWTEKEFADFILKVDWRLPAKGDSGIYLRGSSKSQVNIWVNPLGSGEVYGYRTDKNQPEEVRKAATEGRPPDRRTQRRGGHLERPTARRQAEGAHRAAAPRQPHRVPQHPHQGVEETRTEVSPTTRER
jgi:hypothetical protein